MSARADSRGAIAVVSGPSGVGKSTIIGRLVDDDRFALSISATTRPPRRGEANGRDYLFLSEGEFDRRIAAGDFLEWAVVHGRSRYGTLRSEVERIAREGRIAILDIDVQGAEQVRGRIDAVFVFIAPPSFEELVRRLEDRATEDDEAVSRRLETARRELAEMKRYDHVVVNDDLDRATGEIRDLLVAAAGRTQES